jgi:hypothetical protein
LIWTKCCMYFVFGMWCFVTACIKWHGDVNRMLLLKLLDAQQKERVEDTPAQGSGALHRDEVRHRTLRT